MDFGKRKRGVVRLSLWAQLAGITLLFVAVYVGLRHLPSAQCDFLHYEVVEVLADGTEVCSATNHAKFIDLDALQYPVSMELDPLGENAETGLVDFHVSFLDKDGRALLPHELAVTHTERIHLMMVDPSLEDYHHLHPEPIGATGKYEFSMQPRFDGPYRLFAEMVPTRTRRQVVASTYTAFDRGEERSAKRVRPQRLVAEVGAYRFELTPARSGRGFRKKSDNPVTLRNW